MARSRNIKPGFFMNETLAESPFEARLLFIGLWTLADREGRLEDRPKRIKAELFPFDSFDADPMLDRLQSDGFLVRYEVDGVRFIQIENFVKHQDPHYKEKASQIPPPPGRENLILASGVTRTQRARIYERDGYKCVACGASDSLCIDHVLPVSRGGTSDDDNLQTLCASCNTKKGNKLDGEEKNSRQRRVNVGPNSANQSDASPSDSLIPDSLIPDSLEEQPATRKRAAPLPCPGDVDGQVWADWLALRKAKRAPVTETVVSEARREAIKAGLSFTDFLRVWCRRGSQGLEAGWLKQDERGSTKADGLSKWIKGTSLDPNFQGYDDGVIDAVPAIR